MNQESRPTTSVLHVHGVLLHDSTAYLSSHPTPIRITFDSISRRLLLYLRHSMMLILFAFVFSFLHVSGLLGADVSDGYSSLVLVYRGDELHGSGAIVGDTGERKHRIVVTNQHVTLGSDIVGILFPGFENVDGKSRISNLSFKEEEIEWHLTLASCRFGLLSKQLCDSRRLYWGTTTEKTLSRCHGYELVDYIYETNDKGQSTIEGVIKYGSFSIGRTIYEDRHLDIALIETCV